MKIKRMSLEEIRLKGNAALFDALGPVGMIRYLQQYEKGAGDYSIQRHALLDDLDLDTLLEKLQQREKQSRP